MEALEAIDAANPLLAYAEPEAGMDGPLLAEDAPDASPAELDAFLAHAESLI